MDGIAAKVVGGGASWGGRRAAANGRAGRRRVFKIFAARCNRQTHNDDPATTGWMRGPRAPALPVAAEQRARHAARRRVQWRPPPKRRTAAEPADPCCRWESKACVGANQELIRVWQMSRLLTRGVPRHLKAPQFTVGHPVVAGALKATPSGN